MVGGFFGLVVPAGRSGPMTPKKEEEGGKRGAGRKEGRKGSPFSNARCTLSSFPRSHYHQLALISNIAVLVCIKTEGQKTAKKASALVIPLPTCYTLFLSPAPPLSRPGHFTTFPFGHGTEKGKNGTRRRRRSKRSFVC